MKGGIVFLQKEGGNGNREKFDATAILEKYKDYEFGRLTVEEVSEIFLQKWPELFRCASAPSTLRNLQLPSTQNCILLDLQSSRERINYCPTSCTVFTFLALNAFEMRQTFLISCLVVLIYFTFFRYFVALCVWMANLNGVPAYFPKVWADDLEMQGLMTAIKVKREMRRGRGNEWIAVSNGEQIRLRQEDEVLDWHGRHFLSRLGEILGAEWMAWMWMHCRRAECRLHDRHSEAPLSSRRRSAQQFVCSHRAA